MTEIRPFPGFVIRPEWAGRVASPMHDALQREERVAIMASNPDSFLHVTRRADELGVSIDCAAVAEERTDALAHLLEAGAFRRFDGPGFFAYRIRSGEHQQTGVVVEVPVEEFANGEVRGHEAIQPGRVDALVQHLESATGRSDLVELMYPEDPVIAGPLSAVIDAPPVLRYAPSADLEHVVWRVDDPKAVRTIAERLADRVLYIADGHHRAAASIECRNRAGSTDGPGVLSVLFAIEQLQVLAFHRRVAGPIDSEELWKRLDEPCEVVRTEGPAPQPGSFEIYAGGRWVRATLRGPAARQGAAVLDVARLHSEILEPLLGVGGVGDPRLEPVPDLVPLADMVGRCDADDGALFLLSPIPIASLIEVADRGEVITPKSTYFHPKPWSGVFLRLVDEKGDEGALPQARRSEP